MGSPAPHSALWFLFAHGAGAASSSAWMKHYAQLLSKFGPVRSFDYPYMAAGKKRPDPAAKLIEAHRAELNAGRKIHGSRAILIGKSMGGRIGCHVALQEDVLGVVCLGYPLKGMGAAGKLRDQVLLDLEKPACFVQGTRDSLCPLDLLKDVLKRRTAPSHLHVVESGDHSLTPTKTYLKTEGLTLEQQEAETMQAISAFLETLP